jgi:hypothetical protein
LKNIKILILILKNIIYKKKFFKFEKFINESDMSDLISRATKFENESRFIRLGDELIMAGKSKYPVGTKIKIKNLKGDDSDLSGLTGTLTHPFGGYGDVGVLNNFIHFNINSYILV